MADDRRKKGRGDANPDTAHAGRKIKPLSNEHLSHLSGQLAMLLGAGIPALDALAVMQSDADNGDLTPVLQELAERIAGGASLSEAAALCGSGTASAAAGGKEEPSSEPACSGAAVCGNPSPSEAASAGVFPAYAVELLRIGEETGKTDRICERLSAYYEEQADLHSAVRDALFYPFLMILMMLVLIAVLLTNVMPLFAQVFNQLGASVTGIALVLLNLSNVLSRGAAVLIAIATALGALLFWFLEMPSGQRAFHRFLQRFPLTRGFAERMAAERFTSALQLTQESGMDTAGSLSMCRALTENDAVEARIDLCAQRLAEGEPLAEALAGAGLYTGFYSAMLRVAARTGEVDTVLGSIAAYYKEETDGQIDRLLSRIEPAIVAVTAVIVGIVLLSVILPLMGVMTGIG